jgi:AraC-like DNA-binding protein/mannose-6-phosphate isomerase-like protein (cupin superfamily)
MDGSQGCWYFSTVRKRPRPQRIDQVEFLRTKYGRELLVDAGYVSGYARFDRDGRPHTLDFRDILLITRGRGRFSIDTEQHTVRPGVVFFTRPGQPRRWKASGLDGACVFFTEAFIVEAFSDPRFVERLAYFRADRPSAVLALSRAERRLYLDRFEAMQREIEALRDDAPHALRAVLYELLVLLNRLYVARYGEPAAAAPCTLVERFQARVEHDFRDHHRVAWYARALGVSPGHLNTLCREHLGRSAGATIRRRVTLEAQRLLLYGDLTAAEIAHRLGFEDPSYFTRFFRREAGVAPTSFRARRAWRA